MSDPNKANEMMNFLLTTLQQTKDFAVEQAPSVAREMLAYGTFSAQLYMVVGALSILVAIVSCAWLIKMDAYSDMWVPAFLGLIFGAMFGISFCFCGWMTYQKIQLAPKVYLIEEIKKWR